VYSTMSLVSVSLSKLKVNNARNLSQTIMLIGSSDCRTWLATMQCPPNEVLSDDNIRWIVNLLETDDKLLAQHAAIEFTPTRLLDVGSSTCARTTRLIETAGMPSCPKYVALSYCWGPPYRAAQQLRTTSSTLQQHLHGLPAEQVTDVIRDAIEVA
jgi:hypothetical protein